MRYCHTQKAPLHLLLWAIGIFLFVWARSARSEWPEVLILAGVGTLMILFAFSFARLTVRDEGEALLIQFGPLPVFRRRIAYADITAVQPGRSAIIDGWGIHWIPGRGWTYNLWGFNCVELTVKGKPVRIGTDDVDNLAAFLQQATGSGESSERARQYPVTEATPDSSGK